MSVELGREREGSVAYGRVWERCLDRAGCVPETVMSSQQLWESRDTHIHDENELRGVLRARSVCSDHVRMREPVFQRDRYRLLCTWI